MAAGRDLRARLVLAFKDDATRGLAALARQLDRIGAIGRRIGAIGALGGALSFGALVPGAAAFETQLRDMAITAGNTGSAVATAIADIRKQLGGLALDYRESGADLGAGLQVLLSRGLDEASARPLLEVLTAVRSASGATTQDLAQLGVAFDRLAKIQGLDGARQAFAVALRGGQLGGAELKDMARYLPEVLAAFDGIGVSGQRAVTNSVAMFQVLRDGFGTVEGAAAGFNQLLGQLLSPETVERAKRFGFDIIAIRDNAIRRMRGGEDIDPIEAILQTFRRIDRIAPGGITGFLTDQNARSAFQALNTQIDRYLDLRRQLRAATPAVIDQTGRDRREGIGAELREFDERLRQLGDRFGGALGGALPELNAGLDRLRWLIGLIDDRFPGLVDATVKWGAALFLLAGAGGGLAMLLAALNPVGAAIAVVLGLLVAVALRADDITAVFDGLGDRIRDRLAPVIGWIDDVREAIERLRRTLREFSGQGDTPPDVPTAPPAIRPRNPFQRRLYDDDGPIRPQSAPGAAGAAQDWNGRLEIALAPGLVLRRQDSDGPAVTLAAPNRGLMLNGV